MPTVVVLRVKPFPGLKQLQRLSFGVDLVPHADGSGVIRLIVGGQMDPAVLEQIRARVQTILPANHRLGEVVQASWPGARPI